MSAPRRQRPNRPKPNTAAVVAEPAAVVASTEPAVITTVVPKVATTVDEVVAALIPSASNDASTADASSQKSRTQTNKAIGVSISAARARRHLDKLNLNLGLDTMIGELKKETNAYKIAKAQLADKVTIHTLCVETDGKKKTVHETRPATDVELAAATATVNRLSANIKDYEMKITALSRERTRFSNEASIALSIVCEEVIQQVVTHTMDRVLANKKKIIQISHLHESGIESLPLYPLVENLPSFRTTADRLAKAASLLASTTHDANLLAQAEKDWKKKYSVVTKKKKAVDEANPVVVAEDAEVAEAAVEDAPEEESLDSKTSFRFYVHQVCKELVKTNPQYKAVRVSTEIRAYLSDLLVELIARLSGLVLLTAGSMKNKTVNDFAIMRTVESILIDGHVPTETIEYKEDQIKDPAVIKAEAAKRKEAHDAKLEYKAIAASQIPTIAGLIAVRKVVYPTSGYPALSEKVKEKLAMYASLSEDAKKELAGGEDDSDHVV